MVLSRHKAASCYQLMTGKSHTCLQLKMHGTCWEVMCLFSYRALETAWQEYMRAAAGCDAVASLVPDALEQLGPAAHCPACAAVPASTSADDAGLSPTAAGSTGPGVGDAGVKAGPAEITIPACTMHSQYRVPWGIYGQCIQLHLLRCGCRWASYANKRPGPLPCGSAHS